MITLYDVASGNNIGSLTEEQLQFLIDQLVEEGAEDQDYYINKDTLELLRQQSGAPALLELLQKALGDREDMDIRWTRE